MWPNGPRLTYAANSIVHIEKTTIPEPYHLVNDRSQFLHFLQHCVRCGHWVGGTSFSLLASLAKERKF